MFLKTFSVFFLSVIAVAVAARQRGPCSPMKERFADNAGKSSGTPFFKCGSSSGFALLLNRSKYCNGIFDCFEHSDERNCVADPECVKGKYLCSGTQRCIPEDWVCDGFDDCPSGTEEAGCGFQWVNSRRKAIEWLFNKTAADSSTRKWGPLVHKFAVALYLSDPEFTSNTSSVRKEIAYELAIQLLSRINKKKLQGIRSSELASFVNALLVTCTDPRDFMGWNLVKELRSRVNQKNYTNPYLMLALCNAGDFITSSDVTKLRNIFYNRKREIWTDVQAVALMALSCAYGQTGTSVHPSTKRELAQTLKRHQSSNGTVQNLPTTLLVMQALYAAEPDETPESFDEDKALSYIMQNQKSDGSFGNFILTYYALPVLNCRSLKDISSAHCETVQKDEDTARIDLMNQAEPKIRVRYFVWIGEKQDIEISLSLRLPVNISFYETMKIAAEIDSRFRFEYIVKERKPYITGVYGVVDDAESEQFWFPYIVKEGNPSLIEKSTADVILQDEDHVMMWYRRGNWAE